MGRERSPERDRDHLARRDADRRPREEPSSVLVVKGLKIDTTEDTVSFG